MREVEGKQKQLAAVDDQELVVVTHQVVGGTRHRDAGLQEAHLQFSQISFTAAIGVGDERMHKDASRGGVGQRLFDLGCDRSGR